MRKYNFCAGPSALPTEVLEELKEEILDWKKYGLSVMEMSHRSKEVVEIAETCLLYTSPSPRDTEVSRMPSSA